MSDPDESSIDVVRQATRELARKFGYGYRREKDNLGEYPWEFVTAFAHGGWLGALIPEEYGGLGLGLAECGVMMHSQGVPRGAAVAGGTTAPQRAVLPGDGPQPHLRAGAEAAPRLLRGHS